jgi:AraC-like DNA-binding protein
LSSPATPTGDLLNPWVEIPVECRGQFGWLEATAYAFAEPSRTGNTGEIPMKTESSGRQELHEASAPIFQEIARLVDRLPPKIANMVAFIADHLFHPDLSVGRIKIACHLRDNSVALYFHREVGSTPGNFITDRRLAVADRLLANSWLPIWKVTELVGYSSIQVFSRAYFRRKGMRPNEYRRQMRNQGSTLAAPPATETFLSGLVSPQVIAGHLEDQQAAELIRRLLAIYPPGRAKK